MPSMARRVLPLLIPALAALVAAAPPTHEPHAVQLSSSVHHQLLLPRDGDHDHAHGHHAQPLLQLNDTEFLIMHSPTPPSYWTIDFVDKTPDEPRYPGLMVLHVLCMGLSFFGALPIGIALRSVNHPWHGFSVVLFYAFSVLGLAASALYKKLTPDMYEGSRHGSQGYGWLLFAVALSTLDVFAGVVRLVSYVRAIRKGEEKFSFKGSWNTVVLGRDSHYPADSAEYANLVNEADLDDIELKTRDVEDAEPIHTEAGEWANDDAHHGSPRSAVSERTVFGNHSPRHSDDTLHDLPPHTFAVLPSISNKRSLLKKIGRTVFATAERVLVFAGFMQVLTGIVVYTGGCRGNFINGCLAHLIKGGIFWCYGLVTFARYLGSFSELGWAWNRAPADEYPTAEFVESAVIFVYGITNTWMERFGAHPGDPYTTKQVQHISIAVMFWFAGLIGMGIESKKIRRWLASGSTAAVPAARRSSEAVAEPPSYSAGFNPFPALCIGVTGAAMSAHFQEYVFQVQIHMLWGYLLSGFAVLRCLTYFFLWIAPPRSILPSRPPTEALGSFFLACGGLMFMFSTEELTIAAMRQGHDDMMMFLNVGVAITCLAFCWTLGIVASKGWLKSRTHKAVKFHSSA
ncbi:hypothetical protein CERSUDRAFT_148812 [Gelatoporia subvermispora B]|uniref:Integral membrane protein n=1 Tax=Ceriporiopsis subvermispora (strain B) TaxID=914234 RepID=M2RQ95_CERS8|nr:hypothetical protein CERSUDRAFT_148812 [Gelatoporia subvermispora B]